MWKRKLCIAASDQFDAPIGHQLELFSQTGFDGFFTMFDRDTDIKKIREKADSLGLFYQSLHAPFVRADRFWKKMPDSDDAVSELIECLETCAENEIPIMVAHAFIGFNDHDPTEYGIENFGKLVKRAEELGVKIAFENTEGEEYLFALFENFIGSGAVGFCFDTGHELCYNHGKDMPALVGSKLVATHLNDNLGIRDYGGKITFLDDLHLLPFDGIADWENITDRLIRGRFDGPLTFELNKKSKPGRHDNDKYDHMPLEEYLAEAYSRACRVASMLERKSKCTQTA